MEFGLLEELVQVLGVGIVVQILCHYVRIEPIVGFLLTGICAGPHGLGLIHDVHQIELLAEIGVVFLLFTIGAEFSLSRLFEIRKLVLVGGSIQVLGVVGAVTLLTLITTDLAPRESVLLGLLAAMSSTAVVLKILHRQGALESPHGKIAFSILIFQDLMVVPVMLFLPLLATGPTASTASPLYILGRGALVLSLSLTAAWWIVPRLLHKIAETRSKELFLVTVTVICFAIAIVSFRLGLSMSLGALLAGLIISESDYNHEALNYIMPFQQLFVSLFFVSIGMLLDVGFAISHFPQIVGLAALTIFIKLLFTSPAGIAIGFPLRAAFKSATLLAQIGEFSFVLAKAGLGFGLLSSDVYQLFLSVTVLTICVTPMLIATAPKISDFMLKAPWPTSWKIGKMTGGSIASQTAEIKNHLLIIGFGFNGRLLADMAETIGIPWAALDMNPQTVKTQRELGRPVSYGDGTQEATLDAKNISLAKVVVIAIPDYLDTRTVLVAVRAKNPTAHIIVRTQLVNELSPLLELGANQVVVTEFEAGIEIFGTVLDRYLVPREQIERLIDKVREGTYEMLRQPSTQKNSLEELKISVPGIDIFSARVRPGSHFVGKTLQDAQLRQSLGVTLIAIQRGRDLVGNLGPETVLEADDLVVLAGSPSDPLQFARVFGTA